MSLSRRLFLPCLAAVVVSLGACSVTPLKMSPDYHGPKPLPEELAARFAYKPMKIEPKMETLQDEDDFVRTQGTYEAPCPVTGKPMKVVFEMWTSKVGKAPRPCCVIVPILAGHYPECDHLGRAFSHEGVSCFFVHREDDLLAFKNEPKDFEAIFRRSIVNIRRTLDWVSARPDIDKTRMGMCGISLGAIAGTVLCAVEPRLKRNVLIMGGADLAGIIWDSREIPVHAWKADHARRWKVTDVDDFRKRFNAGFVSDPGLYAPYVDARTVLQFVSTLDNKVPSPCQWKLWEAMGRPGGYAIEIGHYTSIFFLGFAQQKCIDFYRAGFHLAPLRPTGPASAPATTTAARPAGAGERSIAQK